VLQGVAFPKGTDGWSRHQASTLLRPMAEMFQRADIPALVELFTEDCTIRYGAAAEQQGRVPLRRILTGLIERRRELRLQKACIAIDRNKLVIRSEESWKEGEAGKPMTGFGIEVWTMREGKIAIWEAGFSAGEEGQMRLSVAA
jgi:nuclear transport factor 2 (NTF2) superfamily protein